MKVSPCSHPLFLQSLFLLSEDCRKESGSGRNSTKGNVQWWYLTKKKTKVKEGLSLCVQQREERRQAANRRQMTDAPCMKRKGQTGIPRRAKPIKKPNKQIVPKQGKKRRKKMCVHIQLRGARCNVCRFAFSLVLLVRDSFSLIAAADSLCLCASHTLCKIQSTQTHDEGGKRPHHIREGEGPKPHRPLPLLLIYPPSVPVPRTNICIAFLI